MIGALARLGIGLLIDAWIKRFEQRQLEEAMRRYEQSKTELAEAELALEEARQRGREEMAAEVMEYTAPYLDALNSAIGQLTRKVTMAAAGFDNLAHEISKLENRCPNCNRLYWENPDLDTGEMFCIWCGELVDSR